jgi:hypothetical protein
VIEAVPEEFERWLSHLLAVARSARAGARTNGG